MENYQKLEKIGEGQSEPSECLRSSSPHEAFPGVS